MEGDGEASKVPLPFDHFFFCFLPADAAAGALGKDVSSFFFQFLGLDCELTIFAIAGRWWSLVDDLR